MQDQYSNPPLNPKQRYHYFSGNRLCFETCLVLDNDTKIGSVSCQECKNNIGSNPEEGWILCRKLNQAVHGNKSKLIYVKENK